ncbi:uncharacterized protein LOC111006967 [Momordica charantia]|uniref:Uncharacterized protein LOC111006967 n=1 Tax=Momordica charantia TaxID=3673 RepID=A0A6J1BYR4_MOMCH|nr:uncharacterized protein LOC111006967 [Momordica charantia]
MERFYHNINFPTPHIAIKSFDLEVVDQSGNSISLFDTFLHHWSLVRYFQHSTAPDPTPNTSFTQLHEPDFIIATNNGVCQHHSLPQFYGMGSESRKTSTFLPHPYGIEVGDAVQVPAGYEERWSLNVHVIDTRGVEDRMGCTDCWCHLYNVTKDQFGRPLKGDYKGGKLCCYDQTQCRVREGYKGEERKLYVRYRVKWVDWDDDFVVPVEVYIFDVTDTWNPLLNDSTGLSDQQHHCLVAYDVETCSLANKLHGKCNATKTSKVIFPGDSGYIIYGVAHQHIGGIDATLYGEDGRVLCSSSPIYGRGNEIGNENGYVVGMSTCYPKLGNYVKINKGEMVTLVSNYDPSQNHTAVMGLFQIMVAHKIPN